MKLSDVAAISLKGLLFATAPVLIFAANDDRQPTASIFSGPTSIGGDDGPDPNRFIVSLKDVSSFGAVNRVATKVHLQFDKSNALVATLSPKEAERLRKHPAVVRVERDHPVYSNGAATLTTRGTRYGRRGSLLTRADANTESLYLRHWHGNNGGSNSNSNPPFKGSTKNSRHRRLEGQGQVVPFGIRMVQANKVRYGGNVTVCVIDTGYDLGHEDLPNLESGRVDGYKGQADLPWNVDGAGHGTHVTGTIAAEDNELGVIGVAPGVNLYIVRVYDETGDWVYESELIDAARLCVDEGNADIINMSLGGPGRSLFAEGEFQEIYDSGVLLVASAGNFGNATLSYPASLDSVISVAAVERNKRVADLSQRNEQVELAAPGIGVLSTFSYPVMDGSVTLHASSTSEDYDPIGIATISGNGLIDQAPQNATGPLVDCGLDTPLCASILGAVCVVGRDGVSPETQVISCVQGGGAAVIIYNSYDSRCPDLRLGVPNLPIPVVCVKNSDGLEIVQRIADATSHDDGNTATDLSATVVVTQTDRFYGYHEGTSMAAPHVSAVAALVLSNHPDCSNVEIRNALAETAKDVEGPGRDNETGFGIVRAKRANNFLRRRGCRGNGYYR